MLPCLVCSPTPLPHLLCHGCGGELPGDGGGAGFDLQEREGGAASNGRGSPPASACTGEVERDLAFQGGLTTVYRYENE